MASRGIASEGDRVAKAGALRRYSGGEKASQMFADRENPLLLNNELPAFSRIDPSHVEPAVTALVERCQSVVRTVIANPEPPSWENLVAPLDECADALNRAWSPVSHLHSVADTPTLRAAYNDAIALLSAHATELGQNAELHARYDELWHGPNFTALDEAQGKVIHNTLRDFELAGVALDVHAKQRFKDNAAKLAELSSRFGENVLDASRAWSSQFDSTERLSGIPQTVLDSAAEAAAREGHTGWRLTLDMPCFLGVITHADDRALREEIYTSYSTRASDQGPYASTWDNTEVMAQILALRHEQALLLGRENYAQLSIAKKMASDTDAVIDFLNELAVEAKPAAMREVAELKQFASETLGIATLESHDVAYCSEKMRAAQFDLSQEELRPYFPAPHVIRGMFEVARRLFDVDITEVLQGVDVWHSDVTFYAISNAGGETIGQFYLDPYARPDKRGGAWMDECVARRRRSNDIQLPVAYLTCNFTPPGASQSALLTHDEVTTLFHEFGHGLHHLLTQVEYAGVSGINGVAWDAVELPSQLMENWCWEPEALALISSHHETGEHLPESLFLKLAATRRFQAGMQTVRQLEFALFDFRIHLEYDPRTTSRIYAILEEVREAVAVLTPPAFNRFAHAFSHIFGGGYAAGYYSYKWAEALSADAYSKFQAAGIFDTDTGAAFKRCILEQGGIRDAMSLYVAFRGREPNIKALLRQGGFAPQLALAEPGISRPPFPGTQA